MTRQSLLPGRIRRGRLLLPALLVLLSPASTRAQEARWSLTGGEVRIVVPLKPGGAFEAKTTLLAGALAVAQGTPRPLAGELRVDLKTIDTGIDLRNHHLREKYLEVDKGANYDVAVLSDLRLTGDGAEALQGKVGWLANLVLHGTKKQVEGSAELRQESGTLRVEANFPISLTDFDVTPPEYLGVGVGNRLIVKVRFTATPVK
jgi:polyisoprenoid-binding protein YceI